MTGSTAGAPKRPTTGCLPPRPPAGCRAEGAHARRPAPTRTARSGPQTAADIPEGNKCPASQGTGPAHVRSHRSTCTRPAPETRRRCSARSKPTQCGVSGVCLVCIRRTANTRSPRTWLCPVDSHWKAAPCHGVAGTEKHTAQRMRVQEPTCWSPPVVAHVSAAYLFIIPLNTAHSALSRRLGSGILLGRSRGNIQVYSEDCLDAAGGIWLRGVSREEAWARGCACW